MSELEARILDIPGARLRYDVRGDLTAPGAAERVLVLVGSPMDASGFGTLTGHPADRPVVTYDPHGTGRSERTDDTEITPRCTPTTSCG
ncbi:MAG: alpha/beta fold hydrolase [Thermocrispum sp.]